MLAETNYPKVVEFKSKNNFVEADLKQGQSESTTDYVKRLSGISSDYEAAERSQRHIIGEINYFLL